MEAVVRSFALLHLIATHNSSTGQLCIKACSSSFLLLKLVNTMNGIKPGHHITLNRKMHHLHLVSNAGNSSCRVQSDA